MSLALWLPIDACFMTMPCERSVRMQDWLIYHAAASCLFMSDIGGWVNCALYGQHMFNAVKRHIVVHWHTTHTPTCYEMLFVF